MNHQQTYLSRLPDVYGRRSRRRFGLYMITSVLLMLMLFLPVEYLTGATCSMYDDSNDRRNTETCCPSSEDETTRADVSHDSGKGHAGCDESHKPYGSAHNSKNCEADHEECFSCLACDCFFIPFSGHSNNVSDATVQNFSSELPTPQDEVLFTLFRFTEKENPADKPFPRPVPIYLVNQVFLN